MFRDEHGFPNPENPNNQEYNNQGNINQDYNYNYNQQCQNFENTQWQQNDMSNNNWQNGGLDVNQDKSNQNNSYIPSPNYPNENQGQSNGYHYPPQPTFTPYQDNMQSNQMSNFDNIQVNNQQTDLSQFTKNKKKKKGGCLWSIIKFFFWLFLIISVIVGMFI